MRRRQFYRAVAPPDWSTDLPVVCFYEIDRDANSVLRDVQVFAGGRITRNSIMLEQRDGDFCVSLLDQPLAVLFTETPLEVIAEDTFEAMWAQGKDCPFWFPFPQDKRL